MTSTDGAWWGPILFLVEFLAFFGVCALIGRAFDRHVNNRLSTHLGAALDRGDQQIRLAVDEAEAAHRDRRDRRDREHTVPRQLTSGRTPR